MRAATIIFATCAALVTFGPQFGATHGSDATSAAIAPAQAAGIDSAAAGTDGVDQMGFVLAVSTRALVSVDSGRR